MDTVFEVVNAEDDCKNACPVSTKMASEFPPVHADLKLPIQKMMGGHLDGSLGKTMPLLSSVFQFKILVQPGVATPLEFFYRCMKTKNQLTPGLWVIYFTFFCAHFDENKFGVPLKMG